MTELQQYIQSYFDMSHTDLDRVATLFQEQHLAKGAYFVKAGQLCEKLSFVQSGLIRIFALAKGKEVTQWIATQGYFITDLSSLIFQTRARWDMQALTDCTLYTIGKKAYEQLGNIAPNWNELEKRFIDNCFVTLENRVFDHLSMTAEERYDRLFEQNKELFVQVPLQYLASMLGMTPETFSRIRNRKSLS